MKISLKAVYSGGAYWEIEYDGKREYVLGLEEMKRRIQNKKPDKDEKIEIRSCLGFDEHSQLITIINKPNSE